MIYEVSNIAILIFLFFVALVLGLSFYYARKAKSESGYYAAGGNIHWGVNGIAFAGDYLSAASFLGICGMIAYSGYDGFLYSIGYLAGWVVALFIVAEPLKRLGKYTFTDALDSKYNSNAIKLTASVGTLIVSIFYLIPQMVGAGDLVVPLLGMPHWVGVLIVGSIVILIVATAGMTSTTYVQFIKGGLLVIVSTILTIFILNKGLKTTPEENYHNFKQVPVIVQNDTIIKIQDSTYEYVSQKKFMKKDANGKDILDFVLVKIRKNSIDHWFKIEKQNKKCPEGEICVLNEMLSITELKHGVKMTKFIPKEIVQQYDAYMLGIFKDTNMLIKKLYNGYPKEGRKFYQVGHLNKIVHKGKEVSETGPVGPFEFLKTIENSEVVRFIKKDFKDGDNKVTVWYQKTTKGSEVMTPGLKYKLTKKSGATPWNRLDFLSLMIALFLGTSALPHILIRYYTVKSSRDARKSTIVAIAAIGFFYVLTLFMGLGSMVNGVLDPESSNMSGPLLAKAFGVAIFSIISALAFATVLGTVSGLIVASSGAIAHDFIDRYMKVKLTDKGKVTAGKIAAVCVGLVAITLGIVFKGMNVSFLVGLAFAVAASANLPAILFMLFWKKTTALGIAWSIVVGIVSAIGIICFSPSLFELYGLDPKSAWIPLDNPGIFSIPLSIITLIVVSLCTQKKKEVIE